jgi:hypothetical protein
LYNIKEKEIQMKLINSNKQFKKVMKIKEVHIIQLADYGMMESLKPMI